MTVSSVFDRCLAFTLAREGGYVNDPHDPGGATNMGVTLGTLSSWRGSPVTPADVQSLTREEAAAIYKARYWTPLRCDDLPQCVALMVFDCGVNSGPGTSAQMLQRVVGVTPDGIIGPKTIAATYAKPLRDVLQGLHDARLAYLRALPGWPLYGHGWGSRVDAALIAAKAM